MHEKLRDYNPPPYIYSTDVDRTRQYRAKLWHLIEHGAPETKRELPRFVAPARPRQSFLRFLKGLMMI